MYFVTSDGVQLYYEDRGQGPVVLYIHGWMMSGDVFAHQQKINGIRHISVDLRAHGRSQSDIAGMDLHFSRLAQDIEELIVYLDVAAVTLVAWSMGVSLILGHWQSLAQLVEKCVFVCGTPRFLREESFPAGMPPPIAKRLQSGLSESFKTAFAGFCHLLFFNEQVEDQIRESLAAIFTSLTAQASPTVALNTLAQLYAADFCGVLNEVTVPVLLIAGELDKVCFPAASVYMQERMMNSQLLLMHKTGHMPFYTKADIFNDALEKFIKT